MHPRVLMFAAAALAIASPARAALVLEYLQVNSISAAPATGPALTSLTMPAGGTTFIQVALRDTTGNTLAWSLNGSDATRAGPGSLGLFAFYIHFDSIAGVAVNPAPTDPTNANLVDPAN